ncbi:MAG: hypothetical protein AAFZ65_01430 [Planctomycetota bacterium]
MTRTALLARFREHWVAGALPLVVEHRSDTCETLCASPSLWMGGRALVEELAARGCGSGEPLGFDLPLGVRFVQGLVAGLRRGCPVDLRPLARAGARHSLTATAIEAHAEAVGVGADTAWIGPDGSCLTRADLDGLVPAAVEQWSLTQGLRVRIGSLGDDARSSAARLLAPLWAGCELHLLMDPTANQTAVYRDAPPELELGVAGEAAAGSS